ncbi:MAG: Rieske 2Fe-2S domain-containing protein [Thermodesulfobacteriota bacterium]
MDSIQDLYTGTVQTYLGEWVLAGKNKSRRSFLNLLLGGGATAWLGSILYPIIRYLVPPKIAESTVSSIKIGRLDDIPLDTGQIFKFGRKPGILIRTPEGELKAFHAICTHLDCIVQYRADMEKIWCACHNGVYDLQGRNVSGPPPTPLDPFDVRIKDGEVFISRSS